LGGGLEIWDKEELESLKKLTPMFIDSLLIYLLLFNFLLILVSLLILTKQNSFTSLAPVLNHKTLLSSVSMTKLLPFAPPIKFDGWDFILTPPFVSSNIHLSGAPRQLLPLALSAF